MFSIGFLTLDIIIIFAIFFGFFILSMTKGEHILAKIILTYYVATLVFAHLPFSIGEGAVPNIISYVVLFLIMYMLLAKHFTAKRAYTKTKKMLDAALLALASVIMVLTMYYHILPLDTLYNFTLPFSYLFTETIGYGIWLFIPAVLLTISNRGHR